MPKKGISGQKQKSAHDHWILHTRISLGTKFQIKLTIQIFWTKFAQNSIFGLKQKSEHHYWILNSRISLCTKFQFKLTILIFWTKFAQKGYFWSKIEKVHYYWILHIRISLGNTILLFWNIFPKNVILYFRSKTEKINFTTEFFIFQLI